MKKLLKISLVILPVLAVMFAGSIRADESLADQGKLIKPIDKKLSFVFIPKVIHPWYDVVEQGAKAAVADFKKRGIDIEVKFDAPPVADISKHMGVIEANISAAPDGLAISSLDPATDAQLVNDAINAGLNVITFDTDAPASNRICYVGHDGDFQDGYDLGMFLAEKIGEKGKVGILAGSLSAANHVNRVKGFKEAMKKFPGIEVVFERPDNDDMQKAVELTENALQANSDLVGIFGCNASNPIGAARAIKSAGLAGKVHIVGMDDLEETLQLVQEGVIDATKAQRQWDIGYWGVVYLVAMNENHTVPAKHDTGSRIITAEDLK